MKSITIEQVNLLKNTTLQRGENAWDYVLSLSDDTQRWVVAGINSCIKRGYSLDRLTINWETRELRYSGCDYTNKDLVSHKSDVPEWPIMDNLDDIAAYIKDLPSGCSGISRKSIQEESDRLISVAKEVGDFIPSDSWNSFGCRTKKMSGESIVFYDEKKQRVVKLRDPFAYMPLKNNNPYNVLYEHHIHNHFFGDVGYHFLGISQDPVSGSVRLVFDQLFIDTLERPTKSEINKWFEERGFRLTDDGYYYTDGYVSLTDVWADNCLKDTEGNLRFIDPIIRFEKSPKEIIWGEKRI